MKGGKHTKTVLFARMLTESLQYFCRNNGWMIYGSHPNLPPEDLPLGAALRGLRSCPWSFCREGCHGVIRPRHLSKLWRTPALCFGTVLHGHLVLVSLSGWFHQASHVSPHHSFSPEVEKDKKKHFIAKKITIMGNTISPFRSLCVNVGKPAMWLKRYFKLATFYFLHLCC